MRHGLTASNGPPVRFIDAGEGDPLSKEGELKVIKSANELYRKINPSKRTRILCCTSPLLRTQQTAKLLDDIFGFNAIREEPLIKEVSFGKLQGKTTWEQADQLHELFGKEAYIKQMYDYTTIGGESFAQVQKRSVHDFEKWLKCQKSRYDVVIAPTHAANIRAWYMTHSGIVVPKVPAASWHLFRI